MPTFELTGPDGASYELDAPDERAALSAFRGFTGGQQKPAAPSVVADVAKSAGVGLARGLIQLPGSVYDTYQAAAGLGAKAGNAIRQKIGLDPIDPAIMAQFDEPMPGSSAYTQGMIEKATGKFYEPQTVAGEYARTVGEFAPSAVVGPGGRAAKVASAVLPALASETAGQATKGTAAEPYARAGAALAAGGAQAYASLPSQAERAATRSLSALPAAEREQVLSRAQALIDEAQARGIPLSTANAIDAASNGATGLSDLQRHVEAMGRMRGFYAQMPDQVDRAGRATFDTIAPVTRDPSTIGPRVGQAADSIIGETQAGINTATRPAYQAAEAERVGPQILAGLMDDPLYADTLAEIRRDPALNRTIANLPDDSVGVLDLVQRRMREAADNARVPGQARSGNLIASNFEDARTAPIAAAETATGGEAGSYAVAREAQERLRRQYLEPLMQGPIGRLAGQDTTTQNAINALFPANPLPNSAQEVGSAVGQLAGRNPRAARDLVRAHAESVFNEATQNLQGGANQMGGARFAATIRGNPQQAENLDAALRALPDGDTIADGFGRFLDVLEAGGRRQNVGSRTAYNAEELARMKQGGLLERGASMLATGGLKLPARTLQRIEEWRLGRNVDQLARLFSDPDAIGAFRGLLSTSANGGNVAGPIGRLVAITARGAVTGNPSP